MVYRGPEDPPGAAFFFAIEVPETGGDTLFFNQVKTYERLFLGFRERLAGIKVVHSAHERAQQALRNGGQFRMDPIASMYPVVRTHPATGEKALYIQPQFTRSIVGYKNEESDVLLNFLDQHRAQKSGYSVPGQMEPPLRCRVG
ncbi:hypothetical protein ZTR_00787 [Talaromyces verruculosus]|nr:hypothetical protein ZTR_00787 [Talaromyces verruculosus]